MSSRGQVEGLGRDTNGQKEMVNEWNVPGCFKGMLMARNNNFIKDMEDKGGHFIRKLDFIMMEFLAFVGFVLA